MAYVVLELKLGPYVHESRALPIVQPPRPYFLLEKGNETREVRKRSAQESPPPFWVRRKARSYRRQRLLLDSREAGYVDKSVVKSYTGAGGQPKEQASRQVVLTAAQKPGEQ